MKPLLWELCFWMLAIVLAGFWLWVLWSFYQGQKLLSELRRKADAQRDAAEAAAKPSARHDGVPLNQKDQTT